MRGRRCRRGGSEGVKDGVFEPDYLDDEYR